jgi:hypothetical protein
METTLPTLERQSQMSLQDGDYNRIYYDNEPDLLDPGEMTTNL